MSCLGVKLNRVIERLPGGSILVCKLGCLDDSNVGKCRDYRAMLLYSNRF
jgi:hypothetical protein